MRLYRSSFLNDVAITLDLNTDNQIKIGKFKLQFFISCMGLTK